MSRIGQKIFMSWVPHRNQYYVYGDPERVRRPKKSVSVLRDIFDDNGFLSPRDIDETKEYHHVIEFYTRGEAPREDTTTPGSTTPTVTPPTGSSSSSENPGSSTSSENPSSSEKNNGGNANLFNGLVVFNILITFIYGYFNSY
jgi:hypothetical protein